MLGIAVEERERESGHLLCKDQILQLDVYFLETCHSKEIYYLLQNNFSYTQISILSKINIYCFLPFLIDLSWQVNCADVFRNVRNFEQGKLNFPPQNITMLLLKTFEWFLNQESSINIFLLKCLYTLHNLISMIESHLTFHKQFFTKKTL